jgi:hypothetical protein
MKKLLFVILIISAAIGSGYGQSENLKFALRYSIKNNYFESVNSATNHKMGVAKGTGIALLKSGTTINVDVFFIYDYINGAGTFIENYVLNFSNNSKITIRADGISYGSESDPLFTATLTITGGTGEYTGIKGSGKLNGDRRQALKENTIVNMDFDIDYKIEK